jgi:sugar-specific transcriptional regulator TrmB
MLEKAAHALEALGFSEIEALAYCFLLAESPATGYRVSHGIGKPTANTYKAIASLAHRGAITIDDSDGQRCRAVPPDELLEQLEQAFRDRRRAAEGRLRDIRRDTSDDRIYQLASVEQVLERARAMLQRAASVVLVDAFPRVLDAVARDLEACGGRGVLVAVKAYEPRTMPGVQVLLPADPQRILDSWPGEQLNLVVDATEHLLALLSRELDRVHQAVWSGSTFLSCMQHNHLGAELAMTELEPLARASRARVSTRGLSLLRRDPPGLADLRRRFGPRLDAGTGAAGPTVRAARSTVSVADRASGRDPTEPERAAEPGGAPPAPDQQALTTSGSSYRNPRPAPRPATSRGRPGRRTPA